MRTGEQRRHPQQRFLRHPHAPRLRPRLTWHLWDQNLPARLPNYLFQCSLATLSLIVLLLLEDAFLRAAILVAVASTTFIIFVVPDSVAATPRKVIGGHIMGVIAGSLFWLLLGLMAWVQGEAQPRYVFDIIAALAVGSSIFLMVLTNTEHPPAAGTALGLVIHDWSWHAVIFILAAAVVLSAIRLLLRHKLVNLL